MSGIRKFCGLSRIERRTLLLAGLLVVFVRLGLWMLPFKRITAWAQRKVSTSAVLAAIPPQRLSWAVQVTARRIPGANCLTQALALQSLLARAGLRAKVTVGVAPDVNRGLEAHAWLELGDEILVGDSEELARFVPILASGDGHV